MIRVFLITGLYSLASFAQINKNVEIVRDAFGVPHIFGKTDADVAYGLAWAHAEDDFKTIQQGYLAGNTSQGETSWNERCGCRFCCSIYWCKRNC